jgi:hypothetical protein
LAAPISGPAYDRQPSFAKSFRAKAKFVIDNVYCLDAIEQGLRMSKIGSSAGIA